ncbi:MAG: bifunctional 3-deoxy-7-phosphoheptulonate synthase/chorismate mutase type II [Bacteroidetes bacterium]|jgi:chorismate mutase|nr:bifunctional 3-deoxy-7-phosphoheptulonate synthase/chorismate mutase type II [Bacteroidota bacterium]MBT6687941.1 bifunctional 3-deoxy-7-phosphoheptulonate synthase/chorismate mutase type II [Bacteroidota bacterium]MBT7143280.1 bifunctional 3-deoxy-7-phosphoheptulonate synthase/chorismate mutase type II [Bacteroidota bacterium]MBT7490261.1 bifunctional 3-deoxy-7-phosphoheptulonate synthase/chorismate mutase type II [Bacteroidota bacterium]
MKNSFNILPLEEWFEPFSSKPLIIAGPCSAESESQILSTAQQISENKMVSVFRSGLWKPRTRPETFEGVGEKGLAWLQKVKEETGLLTATEVATPKHIDICLKYGIDILWIGARTCSNPFSVQELANAAKGTGLAFLIKNPINPDIELWQGAIERFANNGIRKIGAIHRGFYPFEKTPFRNIPKWELLIELKRKLPNLPILNDPSHISGTKKYIKEISQKALDLAVDGLMIESHISPESALSDKNQQLEPAELNNLLADLVYRKSENLSIDFSNQLEQFREQIDSIDMQMLELLSQRMNIVEDIGKYKCENDVTILQLRRWEKIISSRSEIGKNLGLSEDFIIKLLQLVHKESILKQVEIMKNHKS